MGQCITASAMSQTDLWLYPMHRCFGLPVSHAWYTERMNHINRCLKVLYDAKVKEDEQQSSSRKRKTPSQQPATQQDQSEPQQQPTITTTPTDEPTTTTENEPTSSDPPPDKATTTPKQKPPVPLVHEEQWRRIVYALVFRVTVLRSPENCRPRNTCTTRRHRTRPCVKP